MPSHAPARRSPTLAALGLVAALALQGCKPGADGQAPGGPGSAGSPPDVSTARAEPGAGPPPLDLPGRPTPPRGAEGRAQVAGLIHEGAF